MNDKYEGLLEGDVNIPKLLGKDKNDIAGEVAGMQSTRGWIYICKILDYYINIITQLLLEPESGLDIDKINQLKLDRQRFINLTKLPIKIIESMKSDTYIHHAELDPYDT